MKNKEYTVVGFWTDTDQRYVRHFMAGNPKEAEDKALNGRHDLAICGTFLGHLLVADKETHIRTE